jgi:single-strand DNA-binding protein
MSYEIEGLVDSVFNEETVGNNGFKKRILWLKTEEQYPQELEIQFNQNNTDLLDGFKEGDRVKVSVNVNGRKNTKGEVVRIFNSLVGYRIKRL